MRSAKSRDQLSLLDVLVDGFEKNEVLYGFHHRILPMPDEAAAVRTYWRFVDEGRRWKGDPTEQADGNRRLVRWEDLEILQTGPGVLIRIRSPWFSDWWHDEKTWTDQPLDQVWNWVAEARPADAEL